VKFVVVLPKFLDASAQCRTGQPMDQTGIYLVEAPTRNRALDWARDRDLAGAVVCTAYPEDLQRFKTCTEIDP
jgi:hypothetical protein